MSKSVLSVASCLETLEDTKFTNKSLSTGLISLNSLLQENDTRVTPQEAVRVLAVLEKCLKEDVKSLPYGLSAVLSLLSNAKAISKLSTEDLLPSALAVIKMLGVFVSADNVRYLGVQVILKYPTDVLCNIVRFHTDDVIIIFEVFKEPNFQSREGINKMAYYLLKELLYKMPLPEKKLFLGVGLRTWFGDFIPLVISPYTGNSEFHVAYMELLEKLAEDLEVLDYTKHLVWKQKFLSSVCDSQKFPSFIKSHLTNNSEVWHRMWIVLVKLLKLQVTQQCTYGTPIQAMLGVVENGFKLDAHKVRAFQCWDTLIDILSTDTSPKCLRYIKLLLIPMKVNNAKTPPTLEAKFHTWWKLIHKFQNRFDQFREEVVISFINFMFGKSEKCKPSQIPVVCEQSNMRHLCLQAFVQIVGHENTCNCCSDLPNSIDKFLNKKMLMNYFEHWMHALKNAIITTHYVMSSEDNEAHGESMQVLCIWIAFLKVIAELPPNGVRNDLFNELLNVLLDLVRKELEGINKNTLSSIIFSLVMSLAEKDLNVKDMLSQGRKDDDCLHKIIPIILHPQMADIYRGYGMRKMVEMLKPLTDMFAESKNIECLVRSLMQSKNTSSAITIWTAVADTVNAMQDIGSKLLTQILIWPIRASSKPDFIMDQHSSAIWSTVYRVHAKNDTIPEVDKEIFEFVLAEPNGQSDKDYFKLVVTVSVLNLRLVRNQVQKLNPTLVKLKQMTTCMVEYNEYELIMPVLSDTLVLLLNKIATQNNKYKDLLNDALDCVKHVVNLISKENNTENHIIPFMLNKLTVALKDMSEDPEYKQPINKFLDSIGNLSCNLLQGQIHSDASPNTTITNAKDYNIDTRIEAQDTSNKTTDLEANVKEFTSPKVIAKKQASSIVKTFVENGEEYVVVKSNWRFNPRKLTEKQKEKLQRKREDIPALYQDLSQSQDEFKLKSWKTDSQDTITSTSASNSKSTKSNQTAKEDASNILKTISSFDVVPNIMKNMMNENDKNQTTDSDVINTEPPVLTNNKSNKIQPVTPNNSKSPRMALKDRVFRNVRNLIEKSTPTNNVSKNVAECPDNVVPKTPPSVEQINNVNLIQSAPSQIPTDRPSRMKRKPKKFDDAQLFGLKKRRYSHTDSIPDLQVQNDTTSNTEFTNNNGITSDEDKNNSEDDKDTRKDLVSKNYSTTSDNRSKSSSTTTDVVSQDTKKNADVLITVNIESISADKAVSVNDVTGDICDHEMESLVENNVQSTDSNAQMKNQDKNNKELSETIHILDSQESQTNTKEADKNSGNPNVELCDEEISVSHKDLIKSESKSDKSSKSNSDTEKNNNKEVDVPKTPVSKTKENIVKSSSTSKKSTKRTSRLEKELAIDMVEGHPFLKMNSDKRVTRKTLVGTTSKRKSVTEDVTKTKTPKSSPKSNKKLKETNKSSPSSSLSSIMVEESQEKNTPYEEPPCSEDIIESSQDSTFTTISVKSTRRTPNQQGVRVPVVTVEKLENIKHITETQCLLQDSVSEVVCETDINKSANQDSRDDIELPQNKTAEVDKDMFELTENLDTEPVPHEKLSDDVILINDENTPITLSSDNHIGQETLELAEADTQPNNPADFVEFESQKQSQTENLVEKEEITNTAMDVTEPMTPNSFPSQHSPNTQEDASKVTLESQCSSKSKSNCVELDTGVCSPFKDDAERKQDFLNNTSEISPIKMQRPDEEKSPEKQAETSSDYMVVRLSSPVHSNGEPYHSGSPEFFTDDKVSPDKRDQSPPRVEASTSSSSPSSSLSLKKNKPQAKRAGNRAAHMLGLLCIPDSLKHSDRTKPEEPKKVATSAPARRNLRVLYNAVEDNVEHNLEEEEQTNFLKLKKSLPSIDSSPSVPILKRKLIIDESNGSPAGKRKRVSFHDPPVSTTVSVHKYIEPALIRSPSSSHKRQAIRNSIKSPKRLDTAFKLDTVLSKALESFSEPTDSLSNDTYISLEVTPAVEVVNTSELNDTDPICPALIDCKDPISNVALELSSPTMKDLLIKELEGKVATIGDLAKMTELDVNRLCIKAPKVQIAKKVLADYAFNRVVPEDVIVTEDELIEDETAIATEMDDEMTEPETKVATTDTQTEIVKTCDMDAQTESRVVKPVSTQTLKVPNEDVSVQTVESGSKSTSDIISSCLTERPDFIERLCELLPTEKLVEMFAKQSNFNQLLGQVLDHRNQHIDSEKATTDMDFFKNFLWQRFGSKDMIRFCSRVLDSVHDKLD